MTLKEILARLNSLANPANIEGMARYGINPDRAFGIKVTALRKLAKEIGKDHQLAQDLWKSGYHEARILATMIDDPSLVTEKQVADWIPDVSTWDLCDGLAGNLVDKTPFAYELAAEYGHKQPEFEKRLGFALMAWLPVHDKKAIDEKFENFFPHIYQEADDDRKYVKKAISWALRNIGKRNIALNGLAIAQAEAISNRGTKAANWVAKDVLRELQSEKVQSRLAKKPR